jgi:hypothetical protein
MPHFKITPSPVRYGSSSHGWDEWADFDESHWNTRTIRGIVPARSMTYLKHTSKTFSQSNWRNKGPWLSNSQLPFPVDTKEQISVTSSLVNSIWICELSNIFFCCRNRKWIGLFGPQIHYVAMRSKPKYWSRYSSLQARANPLISSSEIWRFLMKLGKEFESNAINEI